MAAVQQPGRRRVTLGLILLVSATLITLDFQSFGPLGTIQTGFREVVAPFRTGGERIVSPVSGLWEGATLVDDLESENQELRGEVDRLRGELAQSGIDRADYEALLAINGLEVPQDLPLLLARVRSGEVGNFTSGVIEIDVGSSDGVAPDMAVVTPAGVVGRTERVDRNSSTIRLISSNAFVIGAEVAGEVGLARGQGAADEILIEQGIGIRAQIEEGDIVTTTTSERSLFPPNLIIGTVTGTVVTEDASNQAVVVEIAANPVDLRFVNVVLVEPGSATEQDGPAAEVLDEAG